LEIALRESNIKLLRAPVGDKYVLDEMKKSGAVLGGEQSGHIILSREATTGDGLLTAVRVLEILATSAQPIAQCFALEQLADDVRRSVRLRANVVDRHDVGVIERGCSTRFLLEAAETLDVGRELRGHDLDCDVASKASVACAIHLAHATGSDRANN